MKTRENAQKAISLKTATRIRSLVLNWQKEVEEEATAIQIADNVASNCFVWLSNIRQDSEKAETAKNLLKALLADNLSDDQIEEIRDHIKEAIANIRELYADDDSEQKARAEREKARQGREEKRQAEEEKARKTAETKARKARAKAAADAIRDFKSIQYQTISFLDCGIGDFIAFNSVDGYTDTYQIMDLSKSTLYVINGYDSQGRAQYISVSLDQFEYRADGTVIFTDAYDSANIANVKCYRQAV